MKKLQPELIYELLFASFTIQLCIRQSNIIAGAEAELEASCASIFFKTYANFLKPEGG